MRKLWPALTTVGLLVLLLFAWVSCQASAHKDAIKRNAVPWTDGPTDGQWRNDAWRNDAGFPFGQTTPPDTGAAASAFTFRIDSLPELRTADGGKEVLMTSRVTVTRVREPGPANLTNPTDPVAEALKVTFWPGERAEINRMDESHGTNTDIECQRDQLGMGESTICTLSFIAPGSEIRDSYWSIDGRAIGTWPSQG